MNPDETKNESKPQNDGDKIPDNSSEKTSPWGDDEEDLELFMASQMLENQDFGGHEFGTEAVSPNQHESKDDEYIVDERDEEGRFESTLWRLRERLASDAGLSNKTSNEKEDTERSLREEIEKLQAKIERLQDDVYANKGEVTNLRRELAKHRSAKNQADTTRFVVLNESKNVNQQLRVENRGLKKEISSLKSFQEFCKAEETKHRIEKGMSQNLLKGNLLIPDISSLPPVQSTSRALVSVSKLNVFPTKNSFMSKEVVPTSPPTIGKVTKSRKVQTDYIDIPEKKLQDSFLGYSETLERSLLAETIRFEYQTEVFTNFVIQELPDAFRIRSEEFFVRPVCRIGVIEDDLMTIIFNYVIKINTLEARRKKNLPKLVSTLVMDKKVLSNIDTFFRVSTQGQENGDGNIFRRLLTLHKQLALILQNIKSKCGVYILLDAREIKAFLALLTMAEHIWHSLPCEEISLRGLEYEKRRQGLLDWGESLLEWTALITRAHYIAITGVYYQRESRIKCLRLLNLIINAGYFNHTDANYRRLFGVLLSSCISKIYICTDTIYHVIEIIIALSHKQIIRNYLCRWKLTNGICLAELIGERAQELFSDRSSGFITLFYKYLNMLDILAYYEYTVCSHSLPKVVSDNSISQPIQQIRTNDNSRAGLSVRNQNEHNKLKLLHNISKMEEMVFVNNEWNQTDTVKPQTLHERPKTENNGISKIHDQGVFAKSVESVECQSKSFTRNFEKKDCLYQEEVQEKDPNRQESFEDKNPSNVVGLIAYSSCNKEDIVPALVPMDGQDLYRSQKISKNSERQPAESGSNQQKLEANVTPLNYLSLDAINSKKAKLIKTKWIWNGETESVKEVEGIADTGLVEDQGLSWLDMWHWEDSKLIKTLCQCRKPLVVTLLRMQFHVWNDWLKLHLEAKSAESKSKIMSVDPVQTYFGRNIQHVQQRMSQTRRGQTPPHDTNVVPDVNLRRVLKLLQKGLYPKEKAQLNFNNPCLAERNVLGEILSSSGINLINELSDQAEDDVAGFGTTGFYFSYLNSGYYGQFGDDLAVDDDQLEIIEYMVDDVDDDPVVPIPPALVKRWANIVEEIPWLDGGLLPDFPNIRCLNQRSQKSQKATVQ